MGPYVDVKLIFGFAVNMYQLGWKYDNPCGEDDSYTHDDIVRFLQLPESVAVLIAGFDSVYNPNDVIIGIIYDTVVDTKTGFDNAFNYALNIPAIQIFCDKYRTQLLELGKYIGLPSDVQPDIYIHSNIA